MRDIQARRRRKIVGPTASDRAPAVDHDPARGEPDADPGDVAGWENEGGAGQSDRDGGARGNDVTVRRVDVITR